MFDIYRVSQSTCHDSGPGHPESVRRFQVLDPLISRMEKEGAAQVVPVQETTDLSLFRLAHDSTYIDFLEKGPGSHPLMLDPDTRLSPGSTTALRGISGALEQLTRKAGTGAPSSFLLARPPGHHALGNRAMGFCLVNTIATLAMSIRKKLPDSRIAILDFDVHHGNGTEAILSALPSFLYISTHQFPFYPGTGSGADNILRNDFSGIMDIPLPSGTTDRDYRPVLEERILPRLSAFSPDVLLLSAGFDGHRDDPLGGFLLTDETYFLLGQSIARFQPQSFIVSILEGGYNLVQLPKSLGSYMEGLIR